MPSPSLVRVVAATALLGLVAGGLSVSAAAGEASAADLPDTAGPTSVTLVLAAPDPDGLEALAADDDLSRHARSVRLQALLPSRSTVDRVTDGLEARGLTVTDSTSWTVSVDGSASRIRSLFGSNPSITDGASVEAAAGPLPKAPAFLGDDVAVVLPDTKARRLQHHTTGEVSGADLRNASAAANSATVPGGTNTAKATIATVQFSNWDSADLTKYAARIGVPDPVASGQFTPIAVDGGSTDSDGAVEVSLDQEAILATSPAAQQRAYFDDVYASLDGVLARVADDATAYNIVALSSSWGFCDSYLGSTEKAATESILQTLAVKGVTVFSASGDSGIYDCLGVSPDGSDVRTVGVDYPASSPGVVGVGGTTLTSGGPFRSANTGLNWLESAWSCTTKDACTSSSQGGSGGGASLEFAAPSWQVGRVGSAYAGTHRLVPDIAAVGDPSTGMGIYTNGAYRGLFGGTSLAAPVSAALLTNALVDSGRSCGAGDIHEALYAGYAASQQLPAGSSTKVFRDIGPGGANGAAADKGADPSVSTATGYDTVTGLGSVLWNAFVNGLPAQSTTCAAPAPVPAPSAAIAAPVPSASISVAKAKKHTHPAKRTVVATWSVANPSARGETVSVVDATTHQTLATSASPSGSLSVKVKKKHTVTITVTAYDAAGAAHPATASVRTPKR